MGTVSIWDRDDLPAEVRSAGKALEDEVARTRTLFRDAGDAILLLDEAGFLDCNQAALSLFGVTERSDVVGHHPAELSAPLQPDGLTSWESARARIDEAYANGSTRFEWTHRRADGSVLDAEVMLTAFPFADKTVLQAVVRDVGERKRAQAQLERERDYVRHIMAASPALICGIAVDGTTLFANPACEAATGYSEAELVGRNWWDTLYPGDEGARVERLPANGPERDVRSHEMVLTTKEGAKRVIAWNSVRRRGADGELLEVIGFGVDVTDRREREAEDRARLVRRARQHHLVAQLAASSALAGGAFQVFAEHAARTAAIGAEVSRASVWLLSEDGTEMRCVSLYLREQDRYALGPVLQADAYPGYFRALLESRAIAASDAQSDPRTSEFRDGYLAPLGITSMLDSPIRRAGSVIGVVCQEHVGPPREWTQDDIAFAGAVADQVSLALDHEDQRRTRQALEESEARFRLVTAHAHDVIWTVGLDGRFTYLSPSIRAVHGYEPDECLGWTMAAFLRPDDAEVPDRVLAEGLAALSVDPAAPFSHVGEYLQRRRDGSYFWTEVRVGVQRDASGTPIGFAGSSRDTSDRKRLEEGFDAERRRTAALREVASRAAALANASGTFPEACQGVLEAVCTLLGWAAGSVLVPCEDDAQVLRLAGISYLADPDRWADSRDEWRAMRWRGGDATAESRALTSRAPAWEHLPTSLTDHASTASALAAGIRTSFAFPVLVGDALIAVLVFGSYEDERDPDERLLEAMKDVGLQLGRVAERVEAAEALRSSEARLSAILSSAPVGVALAEGRVIRHANQQLAELIGLSLPSLAGMDPRAWYPSDEEYARVGRALYGGAREHGLGTAEATLIRADGSHVDALLRCSLLDPADPDGPAIVTVLDMTEANRARRALAASEANLRAVIDNTQDMVFSIGRDRRLIACNTAFVASMEAHRLEAQPGMGMVGLAPADEEWWNPLFERALSGESIREDFPAHLARDGVLYEASLSPIVEGEAITGVACFLRDVTVEREAERAVLAERNLLRTIIDQLPDQIFVKDRQCRFLVHNLRTNQRADQGPSPDLQGKSDFDIMPEELARPYFEEEQAIMATGEGFANREYHVVHGPGDEEYYLSTKLPLRDESGAIVGIVGINHYVTESRKLTRAVEESEARLAAILRAAPVGITVVADRVIQEANDHMGQMLGYPKSELVGRSTRMLYADDATYEGTGAAVYGQVRERGYGTAETQFVRSDGAIIDVLLHASPLGAPGIDGPTVITALDVTDRKRAEEELRLFSQRQRLLLERTPLGLIEWDLDLRVREWNPAAEAVFGYTREEALGREYSFIVPDDARRDVDSIMAALRQSAGGERSTNANLHRSGARLVCEWYNTPLVSDAGEVIGIASQVLDITAQVTAEAEARKLQETTQRTQRLESIGVLAGGIAHDFNNLLATIMGYGELAFLDAPEGGDERRRLEQIMQAGKRARDLVKQILTFSRQHESEPQCASLQPIVKESLKFLRASLPSTVEFREEIDPTCGDVFVDPTQFHQVVMNLCTNAGYAMGSAGVLGVQLAEVDVDGALALQLSVPQSGRFVRLTVSDTGSGMDQATLDRIFEPFFTTKPDGEGTGLGLSTVHGIVRDHGGAVTVYSDPGVGSVFHVYLPRAGERAGGGEGERDRVPLGSERILVVDDEPAVTAMASETLRVLGYRVEAYTDSRDALRAFRDAPEAYDLVLTDHTMPHFTGTQLLASMRFLRPELPVVIATGLQPRVVLSMAGMPLTATVLMKPYTVAELARAVRDAIDQRRAE